MLGLFSGELIFGGAYYWKKFCVSKWVGLDNKKSLKQYENSLKQLKTAIANTPWAYIRKGLLVEGLLHLRFEGLFSGGRIFGGAYYRNFTVFLKITIGSRLAVGYLQSVVEELDTGVLRKNPASGQSGT